MLVESGVSFLKNRMTDDDAPVVETAESTIECRFLLSPCVEFSPVRQSIQGTIPLLSHPVFSHSEPAKMVKRMYEISQRIVGGILVFDIASRRSRDKDSTSLLAARLFDVIAESECRQVLLDLNGIEFITSDVIGQLIMLHKKCVADNRQLKICGATVDNRLALDLVRFDTLVEMYERKPQAITAFKMGERKPLEVEVDEGFADQYREQAEAGNLDAQYRFGKCLETGRGVEQDFKAAMNWYEKAAKQGHVDSQHALGIAYAYGISVPQDFDAAFNWYKQAADQGHAEAQFWVGVSFHHGLIDEVDISRAMKWYNEAAEQGYPPAHEAIAEIKRSDG